MFLFLSEGLCKICETASESLNSRIAPIIEGYSICSKGHEADEFYEELTPERTSWGKGSSLAWVGHPSSNNVAIKISCRLYTCYIDQPCTPPCSIWLVKLNLHH